MFCYLSDQTFVVISKGKDIFRFSATDAMWILDPFNPIRRVAIYILVHPLFSLFIITTILVNCILMIMPTTPTIESTEWVSFVFLALDLAKQWREHNLHFAYVLLFCLLFYARNGCNMCTSVGLCESLYFVFSLRAPKIIVYRIRLWKLQIFLCKFHKSSVSYFSSRI